MLIVALLATTSAARAQDGSFTHEGVELHYTSAGTGQPAIILAGGPGLDVNYVKPVADFLPDTYRRIYFEQRGTGRSRPATPAPESLTLKTVVADLEALREHLKQERLFLVGHSWGGMLAMAYAAEHPDRVDRLILIGSGGPTLEFAQWFSDNITMRLRPEDIEAAERWQSEMERGADRDKAFGEDIKARLPGYFFDRAKALEFAAQFKAEESHVDVNEALWADLGKTYDLRDGLKKLARPVLIVQGHQDPIGDKTAEDIHQLIAGSTLAYINKCGHFPWLEQPEEFRERIRAFLDMGTAPPAG